LTTSTRKKDDPVAQKAVGIDIGGTGIKGAIVDVESGELLTDRIKKPTPEGGEPDAIVAVVKQIVDELGLDDDAIPVGVCFPAAIMDGKTLSAANVSKKWIGFEAEELFERTLGRSIHFVNDADAAGYAETRYGAAKGVPGLVVMTTLGTGIGTALINDGVLVVLAAEERDDLSWKHWAKRLQKYYSHLEALLYPRRIIVGGGVSKHHEEFLPLLDLRAEIVPAVLRNNAGILGAAALAEGSRPTA
jgi:polyphosphate glucokinase